MPVPPSAGTEVAENGRATQRRLLPGQRAEPPRAPEVTPGLRAAIDEQASYRAHREAAERRSVLRGLVLLAVLVLLLSLWRAGADRAFFTGWWRQW